MLAQLRFEASRRKARSLRCRSPVSLGSLESPQEPQPFCPARGALARLAESLLRTGSSGGQTVRRQSQVALFDHVALGQNHGALQTIPQFPNIAGPRVGAKALARGILQAQRLALELPRQLLQEPV